jgi:hypothetical protein
MKYLFKISIILFIFLSTVPASAQWLYGKAAIGDAPVSISGNLNLKPGGELYLRASTLNLTGNYSGESGSEIYLTVNTDAHGFMDISGTATNETEIIPDIFSGWDGSRIDFVKAKQGGSLCDAFRMKDILINDFLAQLQYGQQGGALIWYIEKTKPDEPGSCLPLIVQLGSHTLLANNNSATNGGYKFIYYYWYKNGQLLKGDLHAEHGGSYYTGGADLETDADYTVEVIDSEGKHLFSCPYRYISPVSPVNVTAYPNPAQRSAKAYIQVETSDIALLQDAVVEIYSGTGQYAGKAYINGQAITAVDLPAEAGVYILKFRAKDYVTNIKLIVK